MNKKTKKMLGAVGAGLISLGFGFAIGATTHPLVKQKTVLVEKPVIKYVNQTKVVEKEVPVEVIKNVTVEVPFEDTTFKQMACDRLLFDDMEECVNEVTAEDHAIQEAIEFIQDDFNKIADELEDAGIVADKRDVELVKIYKDFSDLDIIDSDYDNREYRIQFKIKINDDHTYKYQHVTLDINEGEIEIHNVS